MARSLVCWSSRQQVACWSIVHHESAAAAERTSPVARRCVCRTADLAGAKIGPRIGSSVQVRAGLRRRGRVCVLRYDNEAEGRSPACRRSRDGVPIYDAGSTAGRFLAGRRSMETGMNVVTLSIASRDEVSRRAAAAFRGEEQGAHISFDSVDLLWNTLTKKRWEILRAMTGQGALSIREVARRVGRDVKAVHGDVTALLQAGILDQAEAGVVFPYDAVHVDFTLTRAA